jgi:hypothetical protein
VTAGGRGYHSNPLGVSFYHMVSYLLKKKTLNALSDTNVQKKILGIFSEISGSPRSGYFEFWIVDSSLLSFVTVNELPVFTATTHREESYQLNKSYYNDENKNYRDSPDNFRTCG